MQGLTGVVKFDEKGKRTEFELDIVELKKHCVEKVSIITERSIDWNDKKGFNIYFEEKKCVKNKLFSIHIQCFNWKEKKNYLLPYPKVSRTNKSV